MDKVVTNPEARKILLLGFPAVQKTIISTLMTLSKRREIHYEIIESSDIFDSDILLLDVHDEVVLENWGQLKDVVGDTPVLAIGENEVPGATNWLKRAVLASSLLDTLDEITRKAGAATDTPAAANNDAQVAASPVPAVKETAQVEPADRAAPAVSDSPVPRDVPISAPVAEAPKATSVPASAAVSSVAPANPPQARPAAPVSAVEPSSPAVDPIPAPDPMVPAKPETSSVNVPTQPEAEVANIPAPEAARPEVKAELPTSPEQAAKLEQAPSEPEEPGKPWPVQIVADAEREHDSRILVVDDSLSVWTQMKICLEQISADVDYVSTAEDALRIVERRPYNLIFMDVMLPGRDGYDACKAIKTSPDLKGTPVVMLTSKAAPANKVRGVLSGCNYYLTKPINEQEMKAIVQRFMLVRESSDS